MTDKTNSEKMDIFLKDHKPVKMFCTTCSSEKNQESKLNPIILLHGIFNTHSTWDLVKSQINEITGRKVFLVDLRNHGNSKYTDDFSLQHMAADLIHFMKDQEISQAILIGHNFGGRVAMELALSKPEMVEKLVIEDILLTEGTDYSRNPLTILYEHIFSFVDEMPGAVPESECRRMLYWFMEHYLESFLPNGNTAQTDKLLPFYKDEKTGDYKTYANGKIIMNIMSREPKKLDVDIEDYPVYDGKILFIYGEHTNVPIDEDTMYINMTFPKAEFSVVKDGNTMTHTDNPEEFIKKVTDFIKS